MLTAEEIIRLLGLKPHAAEGGYFRETYRSGESFSSGHLPRRYGGDRAAATAIYYLLTPDTFSAMHQLAGDEVFHFYLGDPVTMLQLDPEGKGRVITLGQDLAAGQTPQAVVPRGVWQGSMLIEGGRFALLGTTVAPGFDPGDFRIGERADLMRLYPDWSDIIGQLTHPEEGSAGRF